jgi:hypothetical protein
MKQEKKCKVCGTIFYKQPSDSYSYWTIKECCSLKCAQESQRNGKMVKCPICGKEFYKSKKSLQKFCSNECAIKNFKIVRKGHIVSEVTRQKIRKARKNQVISPESYAKRKLSGKNHWNWQGGRHLNGDGYIIVYKPEHPRHNNHDYIKEHWLIVEQKLGRFLKKNETVHHINEIRNDNRIENLYLFNSVTEHKRYHMKLRHGSVLPITESNL